MPRSLSLSSTSIKILVKKQIIENTSPRLMGVLICAFDSFPARRDILGCRAKRGFRRKSRKRLRKPQLQSKISGIFIYGGECDIFNTESSLWCGRISTTHKHTNALFRISAGFTGRSSDCDILRPCHENIYLQYFSDLKYLCLSTGWAGSPNKMSARKAKRRAELRIAGIS